METTGMEAIFDAMDIAGANALVTTGIVGFIGLNLLFLAGYYVNRLIARKGK